MQTAAPPCSYCHTDLDSSTLARACPSCDARYHEDCWQENGGCALYGCAQAATPEPRSALEVPLSYWGRQSKRCPSCDNEILAAAVRCRHCGAVFSSAQPQSASEFRRRELARQAAPSVRRGVFWMFACCAIPLVSSIATLFSFLWYRSNREAIRALPPLYIATAKISLGIGLGQTFLVALMMALIALRR